MSPRQQPTSRTNKSDGDAGSAAERQAPLTISTAQISPANQDHKNIDLLTRDQRWRIPITATALGGNNRRQH
jgi:hypothetical protein